MQNANSEGATVDGGEGTAVYEHARRRHRVAYPATEASMVNGD